MSGGSGQGLGAQLEQLLAHNALLVEQNTLLRDQNATLAERVAELEKRLEQVERERDEYCKLHKMLREENERLKRGLIGQKAQRPAEDDGQLSLAVMGMLLGEDEGATDPAAEQRELVPEHTRRRPVRKALPKDLERVCFDLVPDVVEREGRDKFELIGVDVREVLERRPASLVVVEARSLKFVRKADKEALSTEVVEAVTPELPIEKGMAGPGLLADSVVKRWQDHTPLNHLEQVYKRDGIELNRSTICTWHQKLAELVDPLIVAMREDALRQPYVCTDATGVLVRHPKRCKRGHFWVLVAPGKHVLYEFSMKHDSAAIDQLLGNYKGFVVADAHSVYDHLYGEDKATEVGCWSHLRKYVLEAFSIDGEQVREGLACIQALFEIERGLKRAPPTTRARERDERSRPLVKRFFEWNTKQAETALEGSPLYAATGYASNQQQALERFLDDQRLPMHNNISELHLRRQAVGRKRWLFVGSEEGARANTRFVSLLASCVIHKIEPWAYLRDLFCLLPSWPINRVLDLAPANWRATSADADVQRKLDANIYRRATLMPHSQAVA